MLLCLLHKQLVYSSTRQPVNLPCYSVSFASNLSTRLTCQLVNFRKDNSQTENQEGVNNVRINVLLACKRCPLRPLLTPFWNPIKHLLVCAFITYWLSVSCRIFFQVFFLVTLKGDWARICNDFSEPNSGFSYHYCKVIPTTNFTNYTKDFYPLNIEVWTLNFMIWTTNYANYANTYSNVIRVIRVIRSQLSELCFNHWTLNCHYISNHNYGLWIMN